MSVKATHIWKLRHTCCMLFLLLGMLTLQNFHSSAQQIQGYVLGKRGKALANATILLKGPTEHIVYSDQDGKFIFTDVALGAWQLIAMAEGYEPNKIDVLVKEGKTLQLKISLIQLDYEFESAEVRARRERLFGIRKMRPIENFGIYDAKKTELIMPDQQLQNKATNNARQTYSKVVGLNIWESDGGGLQLGIGGRGLSPDRSSNFNMRQDGYDISADALGYPESYYTPPLEAVQQIEIIRGAASLQYGTQFGGMINFRMKEADSTEKWHLESRQTKGSWDFFNSFNSIALSGKKFSTYGFYQYKTGNGWRENSGFKAHTAYWHLKYSGQKLCLNTSVTHMSYLAQQAGGLTDRLFEENPRQSLRPRNWFQINWNLFSLSADYRFNKKTRLNVRNFGLLASRHSLGNLERINVSDATVINRTLISGQFLNFGNETRLIHSFNPRHTILVGMRLYDGNSTAVQGDANGSAEADFQLISPDNPEGSDYSFSNLNGSLFVEYLWQIHRKWSLTPGLRLESIKTAADGYYRQRVFDFAGNLIADKRVEEQSERTRHFAIGGLGVSFRPNYRHEIYGNFSQNYRAINFSDLRIVNPSFQIDSNIEDERGYTLDLGYRGMLGSKLRLDGGLFYLAYNNKIGQMLKSDEPPLYLDYRLRTNISSARSMGAELLMETELNEWIKAKTPQHRWIVFTNLAFTDARYIGSEDRSIAGKKVEMVPSFIGRAGIQYEYKNLMLGIQYHYVHRHFSDASNAVLTSSAVEGIIPSYQIIDLSMQYRWKNWRVECSINNLLNAHYFTRRAVSYPGPGIIPADGRGFYLTLAYNTAKKKS